MTSNGGKMFLKSSSKLGYGVRIIFPNFKLTRKLETLFDSQKHDVQQWNVDEICDAFDVDRLLLLSASLDHRGKGVYHDVQLYTYDVKE